MKKVIIMGSLLLVLVFGWCRGVYKFVNCDFEPSYKAEIVYGAGIVFGYGVITGWFNIEDKKTK